MSILDGQNFREKTRQTFPANDQDVKKLMKVIMQALGDDKVQEALLQAVSRDPKRIPDIIGQMAAFLTQRIMAQVEEDFKVSMAEKSIMGVILTVVSELYDMVERMGSPPATDELIKQTAQIAVKMLDQFNQQSAQPGPSEAQRVPAVTQGGV